MQLTNNYQLLAIAGTTASGKTQLAIKLANRLGAIIISADSRQVYQGMDIVTGKDHPKGIKIYGIDLVKPDQDSSVSHWYNQVSPLIAKAQKANTPVIIVGGTGLYFGALSGQIETIHIPLDTKLRTRLNNMSLSSLKAELAQLSLAKWNSMNQSDQNNPRRLIRAIEVAKSNVTPAPIPPTITLKMIALYYSDQNIQRQKIRDRVITRIKLGAINETKQLLANYTSNLPSMTALGYSSIIKYLRGELSESELVDDWTNRELSYVKRQLVYFRKQNPVWYDRGRMKIEEIYEQLSN